MDQTVFLWLNAFNGRYEPLSIFLHFAQTGMVKALPFALVFWGLWFAAAPGREARTARREALTAVLLCTLPIMAITRALAAALPFSPRPLHMPGFEVNLYDGQPETVLDGWSSMPSDHASLFLGFAVGIFLVHRRAGLFVIAWTILVTSLPRVVLGLHWPSDIIVGWLVGATIMLLLFGPVTRLVRRAAIVPYFEAREALGYPLLFLATFEFARMFEGTRGLLGWLH